MGCRSSHGQDVTLTSRYIIETPGNVETILETASRGILEKMKNKNRKKRKKEIEREINTGRFVRVTDGRASADAIQHRVAPITSIIVPSR